MKGALRYVRIQCRSQRKPAIEPERSSRDAPRALTLHQELWLHGAAGARPSRLGSVTLIKYRSIRCHALIKAYLRRAAAFFPLPVSCLLTLVPELTIAVRDYITRFRTSAATPNLGRPVASLASRSQSHWPVSTPTFCFPSTIDPAHCGSVRPQQRARMRMVQTTHISRAERRYLTLAPQILSFIHSLV